jgi:hypothetical protein
VRRRRVELRAARQEEGDEGAGEQCRQEQGDDDDQDGDLSSWMRL